MNTKLLLIILVCPGFFGSCTTSKMLTSDVKPTALRNIQNFETLCYIALIEKGSRGDFNDSVSHQSRQIVQEVIATFDKIPISGQIKEKDTLTLKKLEAEIVYLCQHLERRRNLVDLKLPSTIDSLLEKSGHRFGLITVVQGFSRVKGNYGKQVAKSLGIGILTLGMFYPVPIKANSTIYALIADSQDNTLCFYRKNIAHDKDPLDVTTIKKQINKLFMGYFWEKS